MTGDFAFGFVVGFFVGMAFIAFMGAADRAIRSWTKEIDETGR